MSIWVFLLLVIWVLLHLPITVVVVVHCFLSDYCLKAWVLWSGFCCQKCFLNWVLLGFFVYWGFVSFLVFGESGCCKRRKFGWFVVFLGYIKLGVVYFQGIWLCIFSFAMRKIFLILNCALEWCGAVCFWEKIGYLDVANCSNLINGSIVVHCQS